MGDYRALETKLRGTDRVESRPGRRAGDHGAQGNREDDDQTALAAGPPAILQFGITHPHARIDREDGRTARGRLQRRALAAGHLAPRPSVRHQLVVTELGRAVLERR